MTHTNIFHVHTHRCHHAGTFADEEYVKKAISLGARSITFTDHAPFPGNPFGSRMLFHELPEYIASLHTLRNKYSEQIHVRIGLEVEYFERYQDYYLELKRHPDIEILVLGQHMYDLPNGKYSFSLSRKQLQQEEYIGLSKNIIQGMQSGIFDVVAHPDRVFHRRELFGEEEKNVAKQIIKMAQKCNIPLEINKKSEIENPMFKEKFWKLAKEMHVTNVVYGYDAHSPKEITEW